jgi:hypothetical protein
MALCPADMKECKPKKRCLEGPNIGQAYNAENPCWCGFGTFDPETCDCVGGCSDFIINYTILLGSSDLGCTGSCIPGTNADPRSLFVTFGSLIVQYSGSVNYGSISADCDRGPVNCGNTIASITGADLYMTGSNVNTATDANAEIFPCGMVDRLFALFTATNDPINGALAGTVYAVLVQGSAGGAIGCIIPLSSITSVVPQCP